MKAEIDKLVREIHQADQAAPPSDIQVAHLFDLTGMSPTSRAAEMRAVLTNWAETLPDPQDRTYAKAQLEGLT
jgi:hypothetical protein